MLFKIGLGVIGRTIIIMLVIVSAVAIGMIVAYIVERYRPKKEINMGCGGLQELTKPSGKFSSGNFPSSYNNNMRCSWHITVEPNKVIHLWFDNFTIEDSITCDADSITLKDELGTMGKYCGSSIPKPIMSLGNSIFVYFDTNSKNTQNGFQAQYKAVDLEKTSEIVGAGGLLQGLHGKLMTPGFPKMNYQNGVLYQWNIQVPEGEKVRLTFEGFDLVPDFCLDFVDVYDGVSDGGAHLGHFCGNELPAPVVSSGRSMVVRFKSDSKKTAKGFKATYNVASAPPPDSGCGSPGNLFGTKGQINSKNYPEAYPANLNCFWDIRVAKGFLIKLHITDLAIVGYAGQCGKDRLTVFDSQQSLGTYCGFTPPPNIVSAGNSMSLSFRSDFRLADRGFSATWEAVIPENFPVTTSPTPSTTTWNNTTTRTTDSTTQVTTTSPTPSPFPRDSTTTHTTDGTTQVTTTSPTPLPIPWDTTTTRTTDGTTQVTTTSPPPLPIPWDTTTTRTTDSTTQVTTTSPPPLPIPWDTTTTRTTDSTTQVTTTSPPPSPFPLDSTTTRTTDSTTQVTTTSPTSSTTTWDTTTTPPELCGGHFTSELGVLQSPNWPSDYPSQTVCTWTISIPSAIAIYIFFIDFELQNADMHKQCVDYVEVFNPDGSSEGRFCGFTPPTLSVIGENASILFLSEDATQENGFWGYWTKDPSVVLTPPPPPPNPWDNITISWPLICGSPEVPPVTNMVNGVEAEPHSWPWQVSMQVRLPNESQFHHVCGGSLIHEQWILTAAHCFMPSLAPNVWRMCLGKHHLNSSLDGPTEECVSVDAIIPHKGFTFLKKDIALVRLASAVNMTREISPVCLPKPNFIIPARHICYVTGWGDEKGGKPPVVAEKLNQATLSIVPHVTCSKPEYWLNIRPSMVCAGSANKIKSTCQGDSGGPLVCKLDKTWEVHGVVSFGPEGCIVDEKPSLFTRVSAFSYWIEDQIKRYIYENNLDG